MTTANLSENLYKSMMSTLARSVKGGKRGRRAEGKLPFIAAIMTTDKGHSISMRFSVIASFHKNDISNWAKKHLFPDTLVVSDGFNCFPAVKDADCDHHPILKSGGTTGMKY